jgi:hypothetical protein
VRQICSAACSESSGILLRAPLKAVATDGCFKDPRDGVVLGDHAN